MELAFTIIEGGKSPDLQSASWRLRRADLQFLSKSEGLRIKIADGFKF